MTSQIHRTEIGGFEFFFDTSVKHERLYLEKLENRIDDDDVAIAKRFVRPGDIVLDLGANIGFTAVHYLLVGASEVHAFEPHPGLFERLNTHRHAGLRTYPFAVSSFDGAATFTISSSHNQGSTLSDVVIALRPAVFGNDPKRIEVAVRKIDTLFPSMRFDFIKADIEGAEMDFLDGASEMFRHRKPRILQIEIKPELLGPYSARLSGIFKFLKRIDYNRMTGDINVSAVGSEPEANFSNQPPNYICFDDEALILGCED